MNTSSFYEGFGFIELHKHDFVYDFKEEKKEEEILGPDKHFKDFIAGFQETNVKAKSWGRIAVDYGKGVMARIASPWLKQDLSKDLLVKECNEALDSLYVKAEQKAKNIAILKREIQKQKITKPSTKANAEERLRELTFKNEALLKLERELVTLKLEIVVLKKDALSGMLGYFKEDRDVTEDESVLRNKITNLNKYYEDEKKQIDELIGGLNETIAAVSNQRVKIYGEEAKLSIIRDWTFSLVQQPILFFQPPPEENFEEQWDEALESLPTKFHWSETFWGKLLLPQEIGWMDKFKNAVGTATGKGFIQTVDCLKLCKKDLQEQINSFMREREKIFKNLPPTEQKAPDEDPQYLALSQNIFESTRQLDEVNIHLQRTLLQRVVDVISLKQNLLNKIQQEVEEIEKRIAKLSEKNAGIEKDCEKLGSSESDQMNRKEWQRKIENNKSEIAESGKKLQDLQMDSTSLNEQIQALDKVFSKKIEKYEVIQRPQYTFIELLKKNGKEHLKFILSLGYVNDAYIEPKAFTKQLEYAHQGYQMIENVQNWLDGLSGEDWGNLLAKEIDAFIAWADNHPDTAAELVGDIVLTCNILGDKKLLDQLHAIVGARAYVRAALGELAVSKKNSEAEKKEELHFRALADLTRYAPIAAGVIHHSSEVFQNIPTDAGLTIVNALWRAISGGVQAGAVQRIANAIPKDTEEVALMVIKGVRGDSIQDVLYLNRNVEILRIVGNARKLIQAPSSIFKGMINNIKQWWQKIFQSKGIEKTLRIITQIIVPALVATTSVAVVITALAFAGPIGLVLPVGMIIAFALATTSSTVYLVRNINFYLDVYFPNTLKKIKMQQAINASEAPENQIEFVKQRNTYISDLQKRGALPSIVDSHIPSEPLLAKIKEKTKDLENILDQRLEQRRQDALKMERFVNAKTYVEIFQGLMSVEKNIRGQKMQHVLNFREALMPFAETIVKEHLKIDPATLIPKSPEEKAYQFQMNKLKDDVIQEMLNILMQEWLQSHLLQGFKDEMVFVFWKYDSFEAYANKADKREKAEKTNLKNAVRNERKELRTKFKEHPVVLEKILHAVDLEMQL